MSDQDNERPERAIFDGLIALVAVSVAVGLVLALVAFAGVKILGFGDGGDGDSTAEQEVMSIPPIEETSGPTAPAITLHTETPDPDETSSSADETESSEATTEPTDEESADEGKISLSAGQLQVGNFDRIDLTGVYPGGEGAVLQVQRFEGGSWSDFPATTAVSNETFSTYVQTGVDGVNRFRMLDKSEGVHSNEVKVTVGQ